MTKHPIQILTLTMFVSPTQMILIWQINHWWMIYCDGKFVCELVLCSPVQPTKPLFLKHKNRQKPHPMQNPNLGQINQISIHTFKNGIFVAHQQILQSLTEILLHKKSMKLKLMQKLQITSQNEASKTLSIFYFQLSLFN